MKKYCLLFVFALAALGVLAKPEGPVQDRDYRSESELPRLEALSFDVDGSAIYGQILVPSSRFGSDRPCVIILHGFAGFTRWDDVAQDLCAAGVVVIIPHHRGAWGSEGEYSVSGCVRDAEALAKWAAGPEFSEKYGTDTNAVFLSGHSMGGNSAVNAAKRCPFVRGLVLIAPCDIGFMASEMTKEEMLKFLNNEGLQVLKHKSDEAVVDDIYANAEDMRFTQAAKALENKSVFLATGEYDKVVPAAPLEEFWKALPRTGARRLKKCYRTTHSLMGVRRQLAEDIFTFIKNDTRKKDKKMKDTVYQFSVKTRREGKGSEGL